MGELMTEKFRVVMFYPDETYTYEGDWMPLEQAVDLAKNITQRPAVALGIIARVIIVDRDDLTCFDWRNGQGVVFPTPEQIAATEPKG